MSLKNNLSHTDHHVLAALAGLGRSFFALSHRVCLARRVQGAAVHTSLQNLEQKGLVCSYPTGTLAGRHYAATPAGKLARRLAGKPEEGGYTP